MGTLDLDSDIDKEVEKEVEDPLALQVQVPFSEEVLGDAESSDHADESGGQLVSG